MNKKSRSLRAGTAVTILAVLGLLVADAIGQARAGAEYNYSLFTLVLSIGLSVVVLLFGYNVIEYALSKRKS